MILKTELNGRIQVEAINSLAVPVVPNRLENLRTEGDWHKNTQTIENA